jgi:hypothetical protein
MGLLGQNRLDDVQLLDIPRPVARARPPKPCLFSGPLSLISSLTGRSSLQAPPVAHP